MTIHGIFLPLPLFVLSIGTMLLLASITLYRSPKCSVSVGLLTLFFASMMTYYEPFTTPHPALNTLFVSDTWANYTALLILLSTFSILILSWRELCQPDEHGADEYVLLLLLGAMGATAVAFSANYMPFFLGLEILSVSLIGLVTFKKRRALEGFEAAMKYLVLSGVSAAILLFGIGLAYSVNGSLSFALPVASHETGIDITTAAIIMILTGILFKLSAVPFHMWILDVMEGSSVPIAAFIAVVPKIAIFSALVRYFGSDPVTPLLHNTISAVIILTILGGNLLALYQISLIKLMACSSIAHVGYLLIAFYSPGHFQSDTIVVYLAAYTVATLGAFSVIQAFVSSEERQGNNVSDWKGLFFSHSYLAVAMTVMLLSLAGIPPTIGFFAKFEIAVSSTENRHYLLLAALIIGSIIGVYYYFNIIISMMKPQPLYGFEQENKKNTALYAIIIASIFIILMGGIIPEFIMYQFKSIFPLINNEY